MARVLYKLSLRLGTTPVVLSNGANEFQHSLRGDEPGHLTGEVVLGIVAFIGRLQRGSIFANKNGLGSEDATAPACAFFVSDIRVGSGAQQQRDIEGACGNRVDAGAA